MKKRETKRARDRKRELQANSFNGQEVMTGTVVASGERNGGLSEIETSLK